MELFVENRTTLIRIAINQSVEQLHIQHQDLQLDTDMSRHTPGPADYQGHLYWIPAHLNSSDTGTKYKKFCVTDKAKMITAEDCSPTSEHYNGLVLHG